MQPETFKAFITNLAHGKTLPDAVYILHPQDGDIPPALMAEVRRAENAANPAPEWNLLKFHTNQLAITFLLYSDFFEDPHPALAEATKINLKTGIVIKTDYSGRANPPILHRKETFLPISHPRRADFAALTKAEEAAGLYRERARIGNRLHWQSLVSQKRLRYEGHQLLALKNSSEILTNNNTPVSIERHRTAIKRYDLSKPVKLLMERGLLHKQDTFFDYGCGHGMDVQALAALGYEANGWDPAFRPNSPRFSASVVNLGYVLNVIENSQERIAALRGAYALTERRLLVSTMVTGQESPAHSHPYGDGFLTKTNTFQKFYAPGELEALIESTLDTDVSTLGLGICVVFRDPNEAESFEASRNRTRINWGEISAQFRFATPSNRERRQVGRYDLHKALFDGFWATLLDLGRLPEAGEFELINEVKTAAGGLNRALSLVLSQQGTELWEVAKRSRAEDVLVYLAMTNFRKKFARREIPSRIKRDIKSFFGDLAVAQNKARELLFAAGDSDEIELACSDLNFGWQEQDALYIYRADLSRLPAILRLYVACAALRYGNPEEAHIIKIHKRSGKVTFLVYDNWNKLLPELQLRIKVNLRTQFVQVFDHGPSGQCLYFKERFMAAHEPQQGRQANFSRKLKQHGVIAGSNFGPTKYELKQHLDKLGLDENLRRKRNASL